MKYSKKIIPPVYFLITIVIMATFDYFVPIGSILYPPVTYSGAILIAIGFIIVVWSAALFGKAGTPIKPFEESTQLVTGGMYQVTRNPMYLGMVLILVGIALLFGTISPFIPIPFFIWLIQTIFIFNEEIVMEETFGDEYKEYKKKIRRWL
jgi:protein-S-isoprenylcysteine O-methyltransferase Ste14